MKVVWISHSSSLEGAERCLVEAVKGLTAIGVINHIILPSQGTITEKLEDVADSIHFVYNPWWTNEFRDQENSLKRLRYILKRLRLYIKSTFQLIKLLKQLKPDLVVTNTVVIPCGAFASKVLGIPHIWYIHEFLEEDHGLSFEFGRKISTFLIGKLSKKVIVNSQAVKTRFSQDIAGSAMSLVYYAVDISDLIGEDSNIEINKDSFNVFIVGRKSPSKGQEDAIKALSILSEGALNIRLWLIGGGTKSYTEYLKSLANELKISQRVNFVSFVDKPLSYMASADVVLMCSKCEAFGRVTVEAMKLGKAVIGAASGATSELIIDGFNGLLYEVGNPNSLADKIEQLYKDKALKVRLEANSKEWANKEFNLQNYASNLKKVFQEIVKRS